MLDVALLTANHPS
uniref:Uncharacterized protein n=1 Tax=Glossina morsitans morsitans TaxID=37546 RepID=A0A1B0GCX9_GLOMM